MGYVRKPKPVIRIYRDDERSIWRWFGPLAAVFIILLGIAGYLFFVQAGGRNIGETAELQQAVSDLKQKNQALREQLAKAVRSSEIDTSAGKELMTTLALREKELLDLREELNFYKSMVESGKTGGPSTISIRSFVVKPTDAERSFHYKLALARVDGKGKPVKGQVQLRLQGRKDGDSVTLEWRDISSGSSMPKFRFQFFQRLEGALVLPEGFEPEHILVKVTPNGKKQQSVQQSFSWNSVNEGIESNVGKEKSTQVSED